MNTKLLTPILAVLLSLFAQGCGTRSSHIRISLDGRTDYTAQVREILRAHPEGRLTLEFGPGVYDFYPEQAEEQFLRVSNNDNGTKRIAFRMEGMRRVTVCGHDTEFRFHGELVPFYIDSCEEITLRGITLDYDVPFVLEGRVIAQDAATRSIDLKITSGNPVRVEDGELIFSGYGWEQTQGDNIVFDPRTNAPYYNTARFLHPYWQRKLTVAMLGPDTVRLTGFLSPELPPSARSTPTKAPSAATAAVRASSYTAHGTCESNGRPSTPRAPWR